MKCEYCENEVPAGVSRCPSCGAAVKRSEHCDEDTEMRSVVNAENLEMHGGNNLLVDPYLYVERKNRVVYVVLGIILGEIGAHNFYAGYIGRGVAQLLITVLSFGLLFWVSWLWTIIELCVVTKDGRDIPFE